MAAVDEAGIPRSEGFMLLSCHTFRTTGYNDITNGLYLGRVLAAGCGGWSEGTCVAEHY